ncbi:MAG: transposase [Thermodesulfobacteriota bacterium]
MARPLRIQYPGAVYHITNRGNERKAIFRDDDDRRRFLEILAQSVDTYQVVIHSFVLMANHYHLLAETPLGNLAEFMRHFNITYTSHFNRRHKRVGHLFQGRYKSVLIDKESYLAAVSKYIHLNPVKVKGLLSKPADEKLRCLSAYQWSSLPGFANPKKRHKWVEYGVVLREFGGDNASGRKAYRRQLEAAVTQGIAIKENIVGQSILGDARFIARIKETFLDRGNDREQPALVSVHSYLAREQILAQLAVATQKTVDEVIRSKGATRQMAMDLLYRLGGMKNKEIGELLGVDYSTVSLGRKRLAEKRKKDKQLHLVIRAIEQTLSKEKI